MGILDIFGDAGGLQGLLSPEQMQRVQQDALLKASLSLLKSSGPSLTPIGTGQALSDAYDAGTGAFQGGIQNQVNNALTAQKIQESQRKQQIQQALSGIFANAKTDEDLVSAYSKASQVAASLGDPEGASKYASTADSLYKRLNPESKVVGNALVKPDGSVVYTGEQKQPSGVQEYEYARGQGFKGTFEQFKMMMANAGAPKVAVNTADPTALAKAGLDFQDKVRAAFKADEQIAGQFGVMQNAVKNPSAQGDTSLLYSFFKVLDPESTVREGELNLVMSSRSIPDKFKGYAQRLATGQTLTANERQDLLTQAQRQVESRMNRAEKERRAYMENARRLTLDPDVYVPDPYASLKGSEPKPTGASKRMVFNPETGRLE